MNEYNKYAALASTIKIEKITSCERKQDILKRLKEDDEDLTQLWICTENQVIDELDYDPNTSAELAWLGYFLGQSTNVNELHIGYSPPASYNSGIEVFRRGMGKNRSIWKITIGSVEGSILPMLDTFLQNNKNLNEIVVEECVLNEAGARQLSLALGGCNKSLKIFGIYDSNLQDGQLVHIITALSMHPQLTELHLSDVNIGRNESMALATLLRWTTNKLQKFSFSDSGINDEGLEVLINALLNVNTLQELSMSSNRSITITGWKAVLSLFETTDSKLNTVHMNNNNVGDDGALVFANALTNNSTLKTFGLRNSGITAEGWKSLSKLLCDASTVNNTYLSNHTLKGFGSSSSHTTVTDDVRSLLALNRNADKQQVAITKILRNHSHFDMQPFFEWEFKVLPIMVNWFTKAAAITTEYDEKIKKMKLSTVYDFIRGFPMLYVEARTQEEIKKHTSLEMQIQRAQLRLQREQMQLASQLEEVQQCKARAMRRL